MIESPLGDIAVEAGSNGVTRIDFIDESPGADTRRLEGNGRAEAHVASAVRQLGEYFAGHRRDFDLELQPTGTAFQLSVWEVLRGIAFGETITYGEQARRLGRPTATRAVGAANGRNPLAIVVPCHRVVGAGGRLTGYASGLERKEWLLRHEERVRSARIGRRELS